MGYKVEECVTSDGENPVLCVIYEPVMENSSSPNTESDLSDFQNSDNHQAEETNDISDWDDDAAVKLQAAEVVGEVFSDLEAKESHLDEHRDKTIETKVKFVMTKKMEAGTSNNETRITRKHKGM